MAGDVINYSSLPEFFREKVATSFQHLRITASPDAEYYLVNLLTQFTHSSTFHPQNDTGEVEDKALALQFFDAVLATPYQRIPILKRMGDVALYVSGFFGDSLYRSSIDLGYYINMGHSAYSSLSNLMADDPRKLMGDLFDELASKFPQFVDVLSDIAAKSHLSNDQNILKLYERWLATGSKRASSILAKKGIVVTEAIRSKHTQ